jgi:ribonuclease HI
MTNLIEAFFDGVCEPRNPGGHAAYGALIKQNGTVSWQEGGYVGQGPDMSNNVAEYAGMVALLRKLAELPLGAVIIRGDSKLVINQLSGKWRVKGGHYVPYYRQARELLIQEMARREGNIKLEWVRRNENGDCDTLSKAVLKERGVEFRIQPEA